MRLTLLTLQRRRRQITAADVFSKPSIKQRIWSRTDQIQCWACFELTLLADRWGGAGWAQRRYTLNNLLSHPWFGVTSQPFY